MEAIDPIARALAQPQIAETICDYLPLESLASAALINRNFFTFATQAQWFEGSLWSLAHHTQPSRRQLYASKVRRLRMDRASIIKYHSAFRRVHFNGLKCLSLASYLLKAGEEPATCYRELHRYLEPQLTQLRLRRCYLTAAFLHVVSNQCQNLRSLQLDLTWVQCTDEALAALIAANPLLEKLQFEPQDPGVGFVSLPGAPNDVPAREILNATLLQCARQRKLRSLQLNCPVKLMPEDFQRICDQVPEPFPVLDQFVAAVPCMAVPLLRQWCKHMQQLFLSFHDTEMPVLQEISKMKNLRVMQIDFDEGTTLSGPELFSLQALSKLETLSIYEFIMPYPQFSVCDDFREWITSFPNLKVLELEAGDGYSSDYPIGSLATLSRCCPRIERLLWPGTWSAS